MYVCIHTHTHTHACPDTPHAHEQVPWGTQTSQGAMLIMLHMPTHQPSCDKECVDTMGFTAKFDLAPCDHCVSGCNMSVPWDKMGPEFEDKGKGFTVCVCVCVFCVHYVCVFCVHYTCTYTYTYSYPSSSSYSYIYI